MSIPIFTEEKLLRTLSRIFALPPFYDDRYGTPQGMARIMVDPRTIFLELGKEAGYVFLEQVEPNGYGLAHIIIFNRRAIPALEETLSELIKWAFLTFHLSVIAAWIPSVNPPALALVTRMGWNMDGLVRGFMLYSGKRVDTYIYSIRKDEALNGQRE